MYTLLSNRRFLSSHSLLLTWQRGRHYRGYKALLPLFLTKSTAATKPSGGSLDVWVSPSHERETAFSAPSNRICD